MARRTLLTVILSGLLSAGLSAQVSSDRLTDAGGEPQNWLTYSGSYFSQRYSLLSQITPDNVRNLEQKWVYQNNVFGPWQATPLVVDGVMYVTQRPNDVVALDARTGRVFWVYRYPTSPGQKSCCRSNNRGVAILGNTLFMATLDAHVVAIDATTGGRALGRRGGRHGPRVRLHTRPARGQGQGDCRHRGRRPRHSRLHRGARRRDRRGSVALLHDSWSRRARTRNMGSLPAWLGRRLRPGSLDARRRFGLADRVV